MTRSRLRRLGRSRTSSSASRVGEQSQTRSLGGGAGVALRSPDLKAATASGSREKETEAQRCKTAAKCPHHGSQDTVMCPERREGDVLLSLRCHSQGGDSDA